MTGSKLPLTFQGLRLEFRGPAYGRWRRSQRVVSRLSMFSPFSILPNMLAGFAAMDRRVKRAAEMVS